MDKPLSHPLQFSNEKSFAPIAFNRGQDHWEHHRTSEDQMACFYTDDERDEERWDGMTDEQVGDVAVNVLLAGYETTANALTWMWYLLPASEAEQKLHEEVDGFWRKNQRTERSKSFLR